MKSFNSGFKNIASCCVGVMALAAVGCGSDGGGGTAVARPGTVSVSLTDAPACGYDEVNVTVSKVRVHQSNTDNVSGAGWADIVLDPPKKINLLNLNDPTQPNFALESLGETPLDPGHYTQLRLVLVPNSNSNNPQEPLANSIVLSNTTDEIPLDTPSGIQTGVKLIHQFTVQSGQRVDLLLDFDACHSIVQTGNNRYKLKPVIKVIPYALNGIEGFIDANLVSSHAVVSAQVNGEIIRAVVPNSNDASDPNRGKFFLAHLPAGSDVKYDVVITADGHATAVITGVPVPTDTSVTRISDGTTRFQLTNSSVQGVNGTVTLDPPDDEGLVIVKAKQTLSPGLTITVKTLSATVLDSGNPPGDYSYGLTLPIGAPSLVAYNNSLPITPTDSGQGGVAGNYAIHVSGQVVTPTGTTVYSTQDPLPAGKDIRVGENQTQDFDLSTP